MDHLILILAGLAAGALNAVAGGGTFISFPALVWIGVPPVLANATSTMAALPGYAGSAWAFRHEIRAPAPLPLMQMIAMGVLGGLLGALLLLVTPSAIFSTVVPWLLLVATLIFAAGPWLVKRLTGQGGLSRPFALGLLLAVSIYGGYFNGGLGIMLLAAFGFMGFQNLHQMNGLKNLMSAVLSAVSVVTYAAAGLIDWQNGILLGLACLAGGWIGALGAKKIPSMLALRIFITFVGLGMAAIFFTR